jgi:hypothetical protein
LNNFCKKNHHQNKGQAYSTFPPVCAKRCAATETDFTARETNLASIEVNFTARETNLAATEVNFTSTEANFASLAGTAGSARTA